MASGDALLDDWFDERFVAAGARSFHFSLVRLLLAGVLWTVLGLGAGWRTAGVWAAAMLLVEWPLREFNRPMARGLRLSRLETGMAMVVYALAALAWSAAGAILWAQASSAAQLAGVAVFAGHLLYLTTHHNRSMGALLPALPALAAPAIAPLVVPHHHGADQAMVEVAMLAMVGQAAMSIVVSFRARGPRQATRGAEGAEQAQEGGTATAA